MLLALVALVCNGSCVPKVQSEEDCHQRLGTHLLVHLPLEEYGALGIVTGSCYFLWGTSVGYFSGVGIWGCLPDFIAKGF